MDKVVVKGLECMAHVGVPESERARRQKVLIDLELGMDLRKAGRTDCVDHTVDYAAVCTEVRRLVEAGSFWLVEALAETAAERILERFQVSEVKLRVRKFSVPGTVSVGVKIFRTKKLGKSRTKKGSPKAGLR